MRLTTLFLIGLASLAPRHQDEWLPLPLARLDPPVDSVVAAGLLLTPAPGTVEVVVGLDNACQTKVSATQQAHGAVVKIRLVGPATSARACPAVHRPEAYRALVRGLKPKRYQVILYTKDAKERWHPWRAAVTEVP